MKHIINLSFFLFFSVNVLYAQTVQQPSTDVKKDIELLSASGLNLSDLQIARITTVLIGQEELTARNSKAVEGNKSVLETRLSALKASKISNIKGALTAKQVELFNSLKLEDKL